LANAEQQVIVSDGSWKSYDSEIPGW
jgi:hypothetical protein